MNSNDDGIRRLEEEVRFLREQRRQSVDALEMAADLGRFDMASEVGLSSDAILNETERKIRSLIPFKALSFYLVRQEDNSFYQAFCEPRPFSRQLEEEVNNLIEDHTFARILKGNKPMVLSSKSCDDTLVLRALATPSRIRGMFVGILEQDKADISDISFSLLSIVLLSCASALESIETYEHMRSLNRALEKYAQQTERLYQDIFENAPVGIFWTSPDGRFLKVNPSFARMVGFETPDQMLREAREMGEELYVDAVQRAEHLRMLEKHGHVLNREVLLKRRNGEHFWALMSSRAVFDQEGEMVYHDGFLTDITRRKEAEKEREKIQTQLVQAQKMESVGRLAGGVAHDFNNMLSVILGHADLALMQSLSSEPLKERLREIRRTAKRSADLVRQLLAFARKQTAAPRVLDLNQTLDNMLKMLKRLIGENVHLYWVPGADLWSIQMDPSQVDQILANLCVNARDAIENVGTVTIQTENVLLDVNDCSGHGDAVPGEYVLLTVRDDGRGLEKDMLNQIFEPFYTTKEVGMGTGLGLATIYGIVKQNNGFIHVDSEPGVGTVFQIYLPRHRGQARPAPRKAPVLPLGTGHETVLLVEDDAAVLKTNQSMLEELGYRVLTAGSPTEAIALAERHSGEIDLLLTDVVMPFMTGRDMAEALANQYPGLKCLYMSGYTADVIANQGLLKPGIHFLQKPFSLRALADKVREMLTTVSEKNLDKGMAR